MSQSIQRARTLCVVPGLFVILSLLWGCNGKQDRRAIPAGQSKIRTIVGEDLEKEPGPVGDWARNQAKRAEQKRQKQGWIQPPDLDLGEAPVGTTVTGTFKLRNPTGKDQVIRNVTSSCTCQRLAIWIGKKEHVIKKASYDPIKVPAGATGRVEVKVTVPDRSGATHTTVRIETSDPDVPQVTLGVRVIAVRAFIIETGGERRDSIDLGLISHKAKRDFEFTVKSRNGKPFDVRGHSRLPNAMTVLPKPVDAERNVWLIKGTIGPHRRNQSAGGTIHFDTDRSEGFDVAIYALVIPPIHVDPPMLAFGMVSRKRGKTQPIKLSAVEATDEFEVTRVEVFDVVGHVRRSGKEIGTSFRNSADHRSAVVDLTAPADLPRGRLSGAVRIHFKGDKFAPSVVRFMGIVR